MSRISDEKVLEENEIEQLQQWVAQGPPRLGFAVRTVTKRLGIDVEIDVPDYKFQHQRKKRLQNPTFILYPGLSAHPWHNSADYEWVQELETHEQQILAEYQSITTKQLGRINASVAEGGRWNTFEFIREGRWVEDNCSLCPITARLLKRIPVVSECCIGYAYFSVIHPNTRITRHCGVSNIKLRCQLALQVPSKDIETLGIRVGALERPYCRGKCFIFDDSFEHEVWYCNAEGVDEEAQRVCDDALRVVLLFDFWHPELTEIETTVIKCCLPARNH